LRRLDDNRWFALYDLLVVIMSGVAWMIVPSLAIWFTLVALLPWVLRFLDGYLPFQRTPFDLLLVIFLITAWIGYWAAYDKTTAWIKVWLIISAILFYYALCAQPIQNLGLLSFLSLCFASAIAIYFFLTYDFTGSRIGVAVWWATHRPKVDWPALNHGNTSGLLLISSIFALYWLWGLRKKSVGAVAIVLKLLLFLVIGFISLTFLLAISHGGELIVLGVVAFWILWKISTSVKLVAGGNFVFPILVLVYLAGLIVFAYIRPARTPAGPDSGDYGINSRAELLERGAYFLIDYPLTGAGLNSFSGLYSQYMLVIPFPYFNNSYNLFLDIAIEQGLVGGVVFLIIYLGAVWLVSQRIVTAASNELRMVNWFSLLALLVMMVYGLFYDNLYNGNGTALLFFPLGMAMTGVVNRDHARDGVVQLPKALPRFNLAMIALPVLALILIFVVNINMVISRWYSNLGALQMSKAELKNFPTNQWATSDMAHRLEPAESTLQIALQYDPRNQTANYRLGLISMLRHDFKSAVANLETADQEAPNHRGIIKNLGYAYVWLGEFDKAQTLLDHIPESQKEMSVYIWWWDTQGRPDLSENASMMVSRLNTSSQ
jgi:tetratricopeptide (TPR) repeat protein